MVLSDNKDADYPYWHCCIIRIMHVDVHEVGDKGNFKRLDILWVCWYDLDAEYAWGCSEKWLPWVGFGHLDDSDTFGFLDPADMLHACHMIPAFTLGQTEDLLPSPLLAH
jgi:hypothetical protein